MSRSITRRFLAWGIDDYGLAKDLSTLTVLTGIWATLAAPLAAIQALT